MIMCWLLNEGWAGSGIKKVPGGHSNGSGAGWEASQGPIQGDGGEAGPGRAAGAAAAVSVQSRRRVAEYVLEPDLARECAALVSLEAAACLPPAPGTSTASLEAAAGGSPPPKLGLHLVVLGHVDAGKSTLMGRLLHDLGCVTAKEVHKNQREAAA
ncbi:Tr-type G domain-containing protein, partial [Haematococcus lacustris]